jgi:hypothetical protein
MFNLAIAPQEETLTNSQIDDYPSSATAFPQHIGPLDALPERYRVFSNVCDGLTTTSQDLQMKRVRGQLTENLIDKIRNRVWDFPLDVEYFLRSNEALLPFLNTVLSMLDERLSLVDRVFSGVLLSRWSDMEVPEMENIEIVIKVGLSDYSALLSLWKAIDEELCKRIPLEALERLVVSVEKL